MSSAKKQRLDFATVVADCHLVRSSADAIQEKANEFTTVAWSV